MSTPQFDIQNVLKRAQGLDISPEFLPWSGVEILTGKKDSNGNDIVYAAPADDTERYSGEVLTVSNPWGTQAQANNMLALIKGRSYQPYEAENALLDPSAELGDGVTVNDVYSGIYAMTRRFGPLMAADFSAPQSQDLDHEYPFEAKANREISRRFTQMQSELNFASDEISAKVSKKSPAGQTSFSWNLTDSAWVVQRNGSTIFRVDANGAQIAGKVTASSGKIGGFTIDTAIYKDTTSLGSSTKGVYLGPDGIRINGSNNAYFKADKGGNIEGNNLKLTGTLTIGGATISADNLRNGANSGRAYGVATGSASPGSYPDYFTVKYLFAKLGLTAEGTTTIKGDLYVSGGSSGQYLVKWRTIIVGGQTFYVLARP